MLDEDGDFMGKAAMEIEEETGIKIHKDILKPLGSYIGSVGGCDEEMHMFYCKCEIEEAKMKELEEKVHGEGWERIRVRFVDYDPEFILNTRGSGLIALMFAYEAMNKK